MDRTLTFASLNINGERPFKATSKQHEDLDTNNRPGKLRLDVSRENGCKRRSCGICGVNAVNFAQAECEKGVPKYGWCFYSSRNAWQTLTLST